MMLTLDELKTLIFPVAAEIGLDRVILFGSYARGEHEESSGIDVIIDSGGRLRGKHLFNAIYKLDKCIPYKTDIFELSEVKKPSQTYTSILNDGITVYER